MYDQEEQDRLESIKASAKHRLIDTGRDRIHCATMGEGPGLILVHGWNNNWSGFLPLIGQLVEDFTVHAIDLPGYGESADHTGVCSISYMADSLADLIQTLPDQIKAVCSLSMGSAVTADFASRYNGLVERVVLLGAPLVFPQRVTSKLYVATMRLANWNRLSRSIGKMIVETDWYGHMTAKYLNMYRYERELIDAYGIEGRHMIRATTLFQMGVSVPAYPLRETLASIELPTLMLFGKQDKLVDYGAARDIAMSKSNLTFKLIDECGHVVSLEQPEIVAEELRDFILVQKEAVYN